jgi:hypothetical protein
VFLGAIKLDYFDFLIQEIIGFLRIWPGKWDRRGKRPDTQSTPAVMGELKKGGKIPW